MSKKKTYGGNQVEYLHHDQSVKNDLKEYFDVLDEVSRKFDDYTAIPAIPSRFDKIG